MVRTPIVRSQNDLALELSKSDPAEAALILQDNAAREIAKYLKAKTLSAEQQDQLRFWQEEYVRAEHLFQTAMTQGG